MPGSFWKLHRELKVEKWYKENLREIDEKSLPEIRYPNRQAQLPSQFAVSLVPGTGSW